MRLVLTAIAAISLDAAAADWPAERVGAKSAWDAAFDATTQTRYIPMQLVVPGIWDGSRRIELPKADAHDAEGTVWSGPVEWRHPMTGKTVAAYDRRRQNRREGIVEQKMALRTDGAAIGRVADSRFGGSVCAEEAKFPLGLWKQGEERTFMYSCDGRGRPRVRVARITIEEIDYEFEGVPHSLRFAWRYSDRDSGELIDHRTYIFVPGRGLASHARR